MTIKEYLIISCTGQNDKIGLKIGNNFYNHSLNSKAQNKEQLVSTILDLISKHKVKIDNNFSILINIGPGSFSSVRSAMTVAKGMKISKKVKLYGFKNSDLAQFNLENIEILIKKKLLEKNLIKPLYLS